MNDIKDALVFTSLKNNVPSSDEARFGAIRTFSSVKNIAELNNLLDQTTIKKACCLQDLTEDNKSYKIKVKIPKPKEYKVEQGEDDLMLKKFGYIEKEVVVPKEMCPNGFIYPSNDKDPNFKQQLKNYKNSCDRFIYAYCENQKLFYKLDSKSNSSLDEFVKYSPICTCYVDPPEAFATLKGVQPACYAPGCMLTNKNAYIDPGTETKGGCEGQFCISVQKFGNISVSDNSQLNLQNNVTQKCEGNKSTTVNSDAGPPKVAVDPKTSAANQAAVDKPKVDPKFKLRLILQVLEVHLQMGKIQQI
jgi:hypothetical protein